MASATQLPELTPVSAPAAGPVYFAVSGDPKLGRGSFKVTHPGQLANPHGLEVLDASRLPEFQMDDALSAALAEGRLTAVNVDRPGWEAVLTAAPSKAKKRLNILAMGLYLFASFLPLVGRIGYYLITSHMLFIPSLLIRIKEKRKQRILTALVAIFCMGYFLFFLWTGNEEGVRILPYKSWLFYEKDFLNAGEIF